MPLTAEERAQLESQLPNFASSPKLQYLAEKNLLPQQNELPSFENPDLLTGLRRHIFGHTNRESQLIKRQEEALVPFLQEQRILTELNAQRTVPGSTFLQPAQPVTLGAPPVQTLGLAPGALAGPQALGGPLTLPPRTGGFSPVTPQLVTNPSMSPLLSEGTPGLVPRMSQAVLP